MPARYAKLSHNPEDADELDAAFQSDDDDEVTPLHPEADASGAGASQMSQAQSPQTVPGAYDFEADYDYAVPPPGSPPAPSALARPNQYGNSNGQLPAAPVIPEGRRNGIFRRAMGALLPTHYQRVGTEEGIAVGGGTNNDGVFANLTAKPGRGRIVQDGESIHVVPEEVQKEAPPSYAAAQADAVPAYYETIVHTPASGLDGEVLVDSMPTGSLFTFAWTMLISLSFQFIGFLLTYLLHTSHASKYGSRAGLGVTIIQYAFFLRRRASLANSNIQSDDYSQWMDPSSSLDNTELPPFSPELNSTIPAASPSSLNYPRVLMSSAATDWMAFLLMTVGWFVLLTSLLAFWRVKRWERGIRQASEPVPVPTAEDIERDRAVRMNLMHAFGIPMEEGDEAPNTPASAPNTAEYERELRLHQSLRRVGLL